MLLYSDEKVVRTNNFYEAGKYSYIFNLCKKC